MQNIKKINKKKEHKIFGVPLGYTEYTTNSRYSRWLGGILTTEKILDDIHCQRVKKGYIGKFLLWQYGYQDSKYSLAMLGISIVKKDVYYLFEKRYKHCILPNTNHIYILNSNLGEMYCFLTYFAKRLLIQDHATHPLFWITQNKYAEIIRLFFPHIPIINIGKLHKYFVQSHFTCANIPCTCIFSSKYYATSVAGMIKGTTTYFRSMVHALHLKNFNKKSLKVNLAQIPSPLYNNVLNKVINYNLQNTPFIFIAPETTTCKQLSWSFWYQIVKFCDTKGWKCVFNLTHSAPLPKGAISVPLSLAETLVFAKQAHCIISLKSGLSELLLQAGKPLHVIYTDFAVTNRLSMTAQQVYTGFKMEQFPHLQGQSKLYSYIGTKNLFEELTKNLI